MSRVSGESVLATQWLLISIAAGLIAARIYLRLRIMRQSLTPGDLTICLAWLATVATSSVDIFFFKLGVLTPDVTVGFQGLDLKDHELEMTSKLSWIANITFLPAAYLCKASILLFYFQITSRVFGFPWIAAWVVTVFVIIAFVVSTSVSLFICLPVERQWTIGPNMCSFSAIATSYFLVWAFHFASDVLIFIIPFLILRGIKLRGLQRVGVYLTFGLGLINLTATLTRFFLSLANNFAGSLTETELLVAIDINFCLIVACLPSLRPYLRLLQGRNLASYPTPARPSNIHSTQRTDKGNFRRLRNAWNGGEMDDNFQGPGQEGNATASRMGKQNTNVEVRSTDREDMSVGDGSDIELTRV